MTEKETHKSIPRLEHYFKNINKQDFHDRFSSQEACLLFLAEVKWKDSYRCRKCGHENYCQGKTPYARRCTRCKHEESATAHTIFHRCKIGLPEAFRITYLVCRDNDLSSHELSRQLHIRQMTCWKFKQKITECIQEKRGILPTEL